MRLKKRDEAEFALKTATLQKLQQRARDQHYRLIYFDEAGFCASPPVQRGWSPVGQTHQVLPQSHCRRSVLGALDFAANTLTHQVHTGSVKRQTVINFLDQIAHTNSPHQLTVVVLDNAKIHQHIDQNTLDRWFIDHRMVLFYLPTYSPELNLIEILWKHAKYHWRRFVSWSKETIDSEITSLLGAYGSKFQINFS